MRRHISVLLLLLSIVMSYLIGGFSGHYLPQLKHHLISRINTWDSTSGKEWGDEFSVVKIRSSVDASLQPAYFHSYRPQTPKPLIVSLHTWSGDYSQYDPLADMARKEGWNYIHPDFRGPNRTIDACLSVKALADIDDAIEYVKAIADVDENNIFVVGVSGGGYATLGSYLKSLQKVRTFLAWVPISDLSAWFYQSRNRNSNYAKDILLCTSGSNNFDRYKARELSPIFWPLPAKPNGRLEIYAGMDDGYTGSVPISHSILFYNRIVEYYGFTDDKVEQADIVKLLTRGIERNDHPSTIEGRDVLYRRDSRPISLVIFDGTHEMLAEYCFDRIRQIVAQGAARDEDSAALRLGK